jgi:toxin ParE1/3/4
MSARILKKASFRNDLLQNFVYLAERDVAVARRFSAAVREASKHLAAWPGSGARRDWGRPELADLRTWPIKGFANYLIIYRPIDTGVELVRPVHGARDIDYLFD